MLFALRDALLAECRQIAECRQLAGCFALSHLSSLHEKTLGGSTAIARARPEISAVPRGIKVLQRVNKVPPPFYLRVRPALAGVMLDRWFDDDFVLPGTLRMHSGGRPTEGGVQAAAVGQTTAARASSRPPTRWPQQNG